MSKIDPKCHVGEIHGIYKIVDVLNKKDKYGHWIYKGVCIECGYEKFSHYGNFSGPKSMATKCTHIGFDGQYIKNILWNNTRIHNIFDGMKSRCYNVNDQSYRWYGKKGIKICNEWLDNPKLFEDWAINNGYDDTLTIDRIDEEKNYSPENCRWILANDNSKYKSTTSLINVDGEIHTGKDWSKVLGLSVNMINTYIRKYGIDNTIEFIRKFKNNPTLKPNGKQSYYDLYMNNTYICI